MKKLIVFLVVASSCAFGTAYTAQASAAWNVTTTWTPNGIPVAGDTVTIGAFTVTSPAGYSMTVGSGAACITTPAVKLSTATSHLIVNGNADFQGCVQTTAAGAVVDFTPTGTSIVVTLETIAANNATTLNCSTGSTNATKFNFNGTSWANSVTVNTLLTGGATNPGFLNPATLSCAWNMAYTIVNGLGAAAQPSFTGNAVGDISVTNVLWENSGAISVSQTGTAQNLIVTNFDWRNGLTSGVQVSWTNTTTLTGGTRNISNSTFYSSNVTTLAGILQWKVNNLTTNNLVIANMKWQNGATGSFGVTQSNSNWFVVDQTDGNNESGAGLQCQDALTFSTGAWIQNSVPANSPGNPHYFNEATGGAAAGNVWTDWVFDGLGTSAQGDVLLAGCNPTMQRMLVVNQAGNLYNGFNGTATNGTILNATCYQAKTGVAGGACIHINEGANHGSTKIAVVENSLFISDPAGVGLPDDTPQSAFTLDYNGYFGISAVSGTYQRYWDPNHSQQSYFAMGTNTARGTTTAAAGTSGSTVVLTAGITGLAVGDIVRNTTSGVYATVATVTDTSHFTLGGNVTTGVTASAVSGNSITIYPATWSDGAIYGTANKGLHDIAVDPGFINTTCTALTWDTGNSGPGTFANIQAQAIALNGFDASGNAATFNSNYTMANYRTYMAHCFTPTNVAYKGTASDGGFIGAFAVQSGSANGLLLGVLP